MAGRPAYVNAVSGGTETATSARQDLSSVTMLGGSTAGHGSSASLRESASRWQAREPRDLDANPTPVKSEERPENRPGRLRPSRERVVGLKKWEGSILEVADGLITVELTPFDHEGPELIADFDADLLGEDADSVAPGDIVYLTTRTVQGARGYPYRTSSLKLRRPGRWSERELREVDAVAKERAEFFKGIN